MLEGGCRKYLTNERRNQDILAESNISVLEEDMDLTVMEEGSRANTREHLLRDNKIRVSTEEVKTLTKCTSIYMNYIDEPLRVSKRNGNKH